MSRFNLSAIGPVVVFCCLLGVSAHADTINIAVPNGDFALPTAPASPGYIYGVAPADWTSTKSITSFVALGGPGGTSQMFGQDATLADSPVLLYQADIGAPWIAGDTYTLNFNYASGNSDHGHILSAQLLYNAGGTIGFTPVATQEYSVAKCGGSVAWQEGSVSALATSSTTGNIGIAFTFTATTGSLEALMGNVTLTQTTPVPEPATISLVATGLFGLLAYAWRRRR